MRVKKTILIYLYVERSGQVSKKGVAKGLFRLNQSSAVSDHGAVGVMCSVGVSFGRYDRRNDSWMGVSAVAKGRGRVRLTILIKSRGKVLPQTCLFRKVQVLYSRIIRQAEPSLKS